MRPETTAVVFIEFQNDFCSPGGSLHEAVAGSMAETGMLANAAALAQAAREQSLTVVHSPIQFVPGYIEITSHPYGILAGVVSSTSFVKGSWGAAFAPEMTPVDGDIVLEGKRGLDAFASTNIDFILRSKGIETVALAGFLTNCCVESTMRSAYEKGYEVITLTDCVAATSSEEHTNAIKFDFPMFSKPMTSGEFLTAVASSATASDTSRGYR